MNKSKLKTPQALKNTLNKIRRLIYFWRLKISKWLSSSRLSLQNQSLFAKRLSLLSEAGISILESIDILKRQSKNHLRRMLEEIRRDVSNGQFLSKSLSKHRRVFGDFAVNIIHVGETSGTLSENLKYLSEEIDKKRKLRGTIIGAFVYPIIIMVAAFGICGFLVLYLFPKLMPIFKNLRISLPVTTRILIWLSSSLTKYGLWLVIVLVLSVVIFIISLRCRSVRSIFDRVTLKIPISGSIIQYYHLANICRTLGLLLKGNMPVLEAVKITGDTSTSLPYKAELNSLKNSIAKGSNIGKQLEKRPKLFPVILTEMIIIGEKTGNLSETLIYLAGIFEHELNEKTKRLSSVIEPIMMLGMGLIVGFIAISIIAPIYEITQHLQPK